MQSDACSAPPDSFLKSCFEITITSGILVQAGSRRKSSINLKRETFVVVFGQQISRHMMIEFIAKMVYGIDLAPISRRK